MDELLRVRYLFILLLILQGCNSCRYSDKESFIPKDQTNENEKRNTLFVFVGEKIDFRQMPDEKGDFDNRFIAKYKVLQSIYGNYLKDTIEFKVYDHYGIPPFINDRYVMLFVSESKGKYYQEKYQYFDLHKTRNGRWASPHSTYDYEHYFNRNTDVKPQKMDFVEEVSYNIKGRDMEEMKAGYPEPYYKIVGDKAIAVYGNYIPELFKLKKDGVLKARKLF